MGASLLAMASVAAVTAVGPAPAAAAPAAPTAPATADRPATVPIGGLAAGSHQVTLVTGDRLRLDGTGGRFAVSVERMAPRPAGQSATTVTVTSDGGAVHAIPDDVADAVAAGRVDRRLFDLTYLAEQGLTDAESKQLPLIVQYGGMRAFGAAEALPSSDATRSLESIGAAAVSVPKTGAARFWATVRGGAGSGASTGASTLSKGIQRIWLDATVEASLDGSVPLIGAPEAWRSGLDGTGTTVAVLDTGADAGHPDLAGQITASESFIPGTAVQDGHGHGTHVATTVAGTGAASGGRYTGVAPGAKLLVGKVLNDQGSGPTSGVIDGMEWAVANGADVVSLSLGSGPTDGTDPASEAVNQLTESSGALFVIAAGNSGSAAGTIAAPATADAALAVAATLGDRVASFSSRGPRPDGALKPDIAAPGVGIVAGRASGTSMGTPVDEWHTRANGTSMATPHVSGAAAILAQQHPDWDADELKAALMSTSKRINATVYETGAGRVDVAKAVSQRVVAATANVDFGNVDPGQHPDPLTKQVTYANHGDAPVTLTLTRELLQIRGEPVPDGAFTGDDTVTVPAGATATATVTLDVAALAEGRYTGAVVATDPAGATLTTPVGVDRQPPKVQLLIRVVNENGAPPCAMCVSTHLNAVDVPDTSLIHPQYVEDGLYRAWVPEGTYSATGNVSFTDPATSRNTKAILLDPEVEVTGPTEITLDARDAREVTMRTPRSSVTYGQTVTNSRSRWDGQLSTMINIGAVEFAQTRLLVTPTERVKTGVFDFGVARLLTNPQVTMRVSGRDGFDLDLVHRGYADRGQRMYGGNDGVGWVPWPAANRRTVELVDAGYGREADLAGKNLRGKLAVLRWGDDRPDLGDGGPDGIPDSAIWTDRVRALRDAGAIGYLAVSSPPEGWEKHASFSIPTTFVSPGPKGPEQVELPEVQVPRDQGLELVRRLERGRVSVRMSADPNIRYTYHLYPAQSQQVPASLDHVVGDRQLVKSDASYHGAKPFQFRTGYSTFTPGQGFGGGMVVQSMGPVVRTDYYGPANPRVTLLRDRLRDSAPGWGAVTAYPEAGRTAERWFTPGTAVGSLDLGDAFAAVNPDSMYAWYLCTMCREGDLLWPFWFDSVGDGTRFSGAMENHSTRLFRDDGEEIPLTPIREAEGIPAYQLPPEAAWYRLEHEVPGKRTAWRFRSGAPEEDNWMPGAPCTLHQVGGTDTCAQQPTIFLGYDLGRDLRLDNTVRAGHRHEFTVFAKHGPTPNGMPRVAGMRVWTSTDDGVTWWRADVDRGRDGRFSVKARYPRLSSTTGAVSLKVESWDVHGNRVEQVLDRAFPLAAR